jgi:VWFA-related protein
VTRGLIIIAVFLSAVQSSTQQQTFRSGVEVIRVPVFVADGTQPIVDLTAGDFTLLDLNVPQIIRLMPLDREAVDVTLVLDVSGSVQGRTLDKLRADVDQIADSLELNDRVRLITFGENVTDVFGFQPGGAHLPVERIAAGGVTSLYAALAAALIVDPSNERPQLVFAVTDGIDNASFLDANRVAALASLSSASLYIALVDSSQPVHRFADANDPLSGERSTLTYTPSKGSAYERYPVVTRTAGPYVLGPNVSALKAAATHTGGALYDKTSGSLPAHFKRALDDFRTGYLLSYTPTGVPHGGWHDIVVRTRHPRYTVRARRGYDGGA